MSENSRKRPRESADAGSPSPQQRSAPSEAAPKKVPVAAVASSSSSSTTSHVVSVANVEVNPISVDEHKGKAQNTLQSLLQIQQAMEYIYSKRKEMGDTAFAEDESMMQRLSQVRNDLISVKPMFRQVQLDTETKKEHALRTQDLLKQPHAQLQNLLYEKRHLLSEIKTCHSFKKAAEKEVELIDLEQFLREAPPQFLPAEDATEHEIYMKRLQYELETRKILKKELQELQARKSVLSGEKAAKVRHLDGMREKVREVELHAAPLQKEYAANGIAEQYKKYETNAARLLPKPLYSLLYILVGWITATDEKLIHVSIIGSEAEAAKESTTRTKVGHHRDAHRPHPLSLHVVFSRPTGVSAASSKVSFPVTVKFHYLAAFDCVTVQCDAGEKDASDLLVDLFPNDNGQQCPNPAGLIIPSTDENVAIFNASLKGRAFRWAQWLAGYRNLNPSETATTEGTDQMEVDSASTAVEQGVSPIRIKDVVEKIKQKIGLHVHS